MLEVIMVLTVLNTAVAVAALVMAVAGVRIATPSRAAAGDDEGAEAEEKPFKLSDKKMQEGIANLLGYQPGDRGNEE